MAVNVLGEEVEETSINKPSPTTPKCSEPDYSPYDDLAFVMYVDNEIAELVRKLDERKKAAVNRKYIYMHLRLHFPIKSIPFNQYYYIHRCLEITY